MIKGAIYLRRMPALLPISTPMKLIEYFCNNPATELKVKASKRKMMTRVIIKMDQRKNRRKCLLLGILNILFIACSSE
jgi:hypothetical protein